MEDRILYEDTPEPSEDRIDSSMHTQAISETPSATLGVSVNDVDVSDPVNPVEPTESQGLVLESMEAQGVEHTVPRSPTSDQVVTGTLDEDLQNAASA